MFQAQIVPFNVNKEASFNVLNNITAAFRLTVKPIITLTQNSFTIPVLNCSTLSPSSYLSILNALSLVQ